MKESDQLMTSFVTLYESYCYITMPFGLKNTSATYLRCMPRCFGELIGRTVEAYVDNIIVKCKKTDHLVADLEETFARLRANGVNLNPKNCVFVVPRGTLLGFIIFEH